MSEISTFNKVFLQENLKKSQEISVIFPKEDENGRYREESFIRLGGGDVNLRKNKPNAWYPIYVSPDLQHITLEKRRGYTAILSITENGQERTWKLIPEGFLKRLGEGDIYAKKINDDIKLFEKYRLSRGSPVTTMWVNPKYNAKTYGTDLLQDLFNKKLFSYPKSLWSVADVLKIITKDDDIVLDFFAGSGTTGQAVLELNKEDGGNRQFILCEQLDYVDTVTVPRVQKVIQKQSGGDFVYLELMKWNENFVEKIQKAKTKEELKKLWGTMKKKAFLSYKVDVKAFDENAKDLPALRASRQASFADLSTENQKRFLLECLDKNHLYVNYSEIDDNEYEVSKEDKKLNKEFYKS